MLRPSTRRRDLVGGTEQRVTPHAAAAAKPRPSPSPLPPGRLRGGPGEGGSEAGEASATERAVEPKRERNAAATRKRLLDAAEREFASRGFAGARLREIADAAGVQTALIHHYFADKRGLYRAVLERALSPTSVESQTILDSRPDVEGLVRGFVDMLVQFYADHEHLLAILRHAAVDDDPVVLEVVRERAQPILTAVTAFLEERQRVGEVRRDVPVGEMVLAALSAVVYPFAEAKLIEALLPDAAPRGGEGLERRKRALVTMLLAAMRPDEASAR